MKKTILSLVLGLVSSSAMAASDGPHFSAFTDKGILYVTTLVLGGTCNDVYGNLQIDPSCKADRVTKNRAPLCFATLDLSETTMQCQKMDVVPKVIAIDLAKSNIAPEALQLNLKMGDDTVRVIINR
jgi:hypothetical protein